MNADLIDLGTQVAMMSLLALSAYLLLTVGLVSFGQQAFFGLGAYAAGIASALLGWPLWLALLTAMVVGALGCSALALLTLRLRNFEFTIASLAAAEGLRLLLQRWNWQVLRDGELVGPAAENGFGGIRAALQAGWQPAEFAGAVALLLFCVLMLLRIIEGRASGRAMRACGESPLLAAQIGINVVGVQLAVAAASGALAGASGGLYAHHSTFVEPGIFSVMLGIHALAYGLIGGLGTVFGPLLGVSFDLGLLAGLRSLSDLRMIVFGGLVAAFVAWRPRGLLDERAVTQIGSMTRRVLSRKRHACH